MGLLQIVKIHVSAEGTNMVLHLMHTSPRTARHVAGVIGVLSLVLGVIAITMFQFWQHFRHPTWPNIQKLYLRIILLCPIYAVCSWLSIVFTHHASYFDAIRGVYEAYVLYVFASLMIIFRGIVKCFHLLFFVFNHQCRG